MPNSFSGIGGWSAIDADWRDSKQGISAAIDLKQDKLTAGTDLVINNGIIKVNTDGSANGVYTFVEGSATIATADYSHAEGWNTSAYGKESHAEGACTLASGNFGAHSEGADTSAIGDNSHAEGYLSISIGEDSHAEGWGSKSEGEDSHAEGSYTSAVGWVSHAEGEFTSAIGDASHTEGTNTIAFDTDMHAGGKYNKTTANAAFVIGNGTDNSARSDAFIIDWIGNTSAIGTLAISGINDVGAEINNKLNSADAFTQSSADTLYYPLSNNPSGYLTEISGDFSGNNVSATTIKLFNKEDTGVVYTSSVNITPSSIRIERTNPVSVTDYINMEQGVISVGAGGGTSKTEINKSKITMNNNGSVNFIIMDENGLSAGGNQQTTVSISWKDLITKVNALT